MQITVKTPMKLALVLVLLVMVQGLAFAQGKGRGGGGGGPPPGAGKPAGVGVDRGINTSSDRSNGRADMGRNTASDRSNGRSDAGIERARLQRENAQKADDELRKNPRFATNLHMNANDLRSGYQAALAANPNLTFGNYVAANRLSANLGRTHPNITTSAILNGLAGGSSIGRTLQNLGLSKDEANVAKKRVEQEIKDARRN